MKRTKERPLPSGRVSVRQAYALFFISVLFGLFFMYLCGLKSLAVAFGALFIYNFLYTPLKRKTSFSLFVGAMVGALPPLAGYITATGKISEEGIMLSLFIYSYQIPHTLSLFHIFGNEWASAGFKTFAHLPQEKLNLFIISTLVISLAVGVLVVFSFSELKFSIPFLLFSIFVVIRALKNIKKLFLDLNIFMLSVLSFLIMYKMAQ